MQEKLWDGTKTQKFTQVLIKTREGDSRHTNTRMFSLTQMHFAVDQNCSRYFCFALSRDLELGSGVWTVAGYN